MCTCVCVFVDICDWCFVLGCADRCEVCSHVDFLVGLVFDLQLDGVDRGAEQVVSLGVIEHTLRL